MKNIHKYIMFFVMAFAVASCTEEEIVENKVVGKPGEEVKFSLSLDNASRTVYEEAESAFPIYWVDGDKVQVYSPHAAEDRDNAEYKVILPENVEKPNYAEDLVKTGDCGVQWGEGYTDTDGNTGLHDFYSIYPSGNYTFNSNASGNVLASGVKVNAKQTVYYDSQNNGFVHDMSNCLMYAYTPKVDIDEDKVVVNLSYNPLSTVFWVEMKAADAPENPTGDQIKNFKIYGITLTSSEANIAGDFILNVSDGTLNSWIGGTKSVDIALRVGEQENYTLNAGQTVKFPVFIAPVSSWGKSELTISINTDQGTFTKTIINTSNSSSLKPGEIHKIKLPELNVGTAKEWDVATWMRYIPRNVYLSELSIPGTWNSLNSDCQSNISIEDQYKLGVRAFHLDTRWSTTVAAGHSIFDKYYLKSDLSSDNMYLSVADGGTGRDVREKSGIGVIGSSESLGQIMDGNNTSFKDYLLQITDKVQPDEYMVLFCTFAQGSYNDVTITGKTWIQAISDVCASNSKVYNGSTINSNTLVGDVLGHVIVVVNLDVSVKDATLPSGSKCLFTYVPMNLPANHYDTTTSHIDDLYKSTGKSGISMYTSHAQISSNGTDPTDCGGRGYSFPLTSRDNLVQSIWDWSESNYGTSNYNHDKWIYLGLGGNISTSSDGKGGGYDTVENRYASMVYDRIDEMGKNGVPFYPMGIILMNNIKGSNYTDSNGTELKYGFADVCSKILMLNNQYTLQYDSDKPADYDPNFYQPGTGDGEGTEGGDIEL